MKDIKDTYDNEAKIYAFTSRQVTPFYDLALDKLVESLPVRKRVLDVCCGTGILTRRICEKMPEAFVLGVDLSSGMLEVLKKNLLLKNVSFVCCDILDLDKKGQKEESFDLAVSSFGIHNIHTKKAKIKALKNIALMLKKGGLFFCCDYLLGKDKAEIDKFTKIEIEHLKKSFDEKEIKEWTSLLAEEDDPETWENNKILLEKAGFGKIKLVWQKDFLAVWCAEKL